MGLALRGPAFTTPEATENDFAFARELGLPISVHVGVTGFPGSIETLDKVGLLGPDINHFRANQLTDREFDLIAGSGGSISVCPSVGMLMAPGTYPLPVLRSPAVSPPRWAWTQRPAPALTCSPRCAWRWRPSVHVPTPARYAAARQPRPLN